MDLFKKQSGMIGMSGSKSLDVCYVFRKRNPLFFSIEKIFLQVASLLAKRLTKTQIIVPCDRLTPWNILRNLLAIRKSRADIFHVTGDVHYVVLGLPRKRTVLTIHDCVFMNHPSYYKRTLLKYLFLKWPVKYCSIVTTISEKSRQDIINYTGCSPDKVFVIPNPLDQAFSYVEREFNSRTPVILFIGSTPNKNLARVIQAIKGINCILEIVGKIDEDLLQLMSAENIQFRQSTGISDGQLINKYIECDLVLFPSTYEGFGLPIIEAQQTGRAVITSNISPMKEVAGNAACLVDPFSVQSIREGVLKVIEDNDYRQVLINKGLVNAQCYDAEQVANEYFLVYQRLYASLN